LRIVERADLPAARNLGRQFMRHFIRTLGDSRFARAISVLGSVGLACTVLTLARAQDSEHAGQLELTYSLQVVTQAVPTSDPKCPLKVLVEGAGLTSLLGPVHDVQSHCAHEDGSVDQGVFTFTGAALGGALSGGDDSDDSISGQYRARLVPSVGSVFTVPPSGFWLTYGEICIWKGTGRFAGVVNDCPTSTSSGRFFPARLTLDLNSGQGHVFGTAIVRLGSSQ
jgi:hypothetical protein